MMGTIHQTKREIRGLHTVPGRITADARGKSGGLPRTDTTKLEKVRILNKQIEKNAARVCDVFGIGRGTFFAYLAEQRQENQAP
jgi:DNA invertase Pin-like site-specific DNA recombinase